ncbi:hypothetical protein [Micromonospora sp. GCM10011541]|uniref:hypothetical protein n=1 Tax=Micromonospora sp. GCM10011541 TaxID=3317336 RepID=UPI00360DCF73
MKGQQSAASSLVMILVVALCCAGGLVVKAKAPCWVFSLSNSAEIPARCLSSFTK